MFNDDPENPQATPGIRRRTLIGAAGALGIAATAVRVLPADADTGAAARPEF